MIVPHEAQIHRKLAAFIHVGNEMSFDVTITPSVSFDLLVLCH